MAPAVNMISLLRFGLVGLAVLFAACAAGTTGRAETPGSAQLLRADEIATAGVFSLYEAVERLRPRWLQARPGVSLTNPADALPRVFQDGVELGPPARLADIPAGSVVEVRFLDAREATFRYGAGYPAGVIEVVLRR